MKVAGGKEKEHAMTLGKKFPISRCSS